MSCCGKVREQFRSQSYGTNTSVSPARPHPQAAPLPRVLFQYTGPTTMVAIGPVSGRRYRFDGPGARVEVDPRDRRFLAGIPRLRRTS
jgi:hypothetical protein